MANVIEPDGFPKGRAIPEELDNASIIDLQKRLENQAGKQLRKCELPRAKLMGLLGQRSLADPVRRQKHPLW
jgi:hypothetical protein